MTYSQQIREIWGDAPSPVAKAKQSVGGTLKLSLSQRMRLATAIMGLRQSTKRMNNLELTLADGSPITIDSTGEDVAVGDAVSIDGNAAPDGEYKLHGGKVIVVAGGKIAEIRPFDMKARAITSVRQRAGIVTPRVGHTSAEQRAMAIEANRRRAGL